MSSPSVAPSLGDAARTWGYVGLNSFGGPAGQIAVMHRVVVDERQWIDEKRYLHALNFCMVLPGPEALQLAVYLGWVLNGVMGALIAGVLFVLPGLAVMAVLAGVYASFGDISWISALLFGIQTAVIAIVVQAVIRVGRRSLRTPLLIALAVSAFIALALFGVLFPFVVIAALGIGWVVGRRAPDALQVRVDGDAEVDHVAQVVGALGASGRIRRTRPLGSAAGSDHGHPWDGEHLQPTGLALREDGGAVLRRCVRGALVCVPAGGRELRLAGTARHGCGPGTGRDDAWPPCSCHDVRRLRRCLPGL